MQKGWKIVAVSDTHSSVDQLQHLIDHKVEGDMFIHAGDFTRYGRQQHFLAFISRLQQLSFRHKIVIPGNHEVELDTLMKPQHKQYLQQRYCCSLTRSTILQNIQKHAHYLEHDLLQIEGLRIFGSPYTQSYGKGAFQYPKREDELVWSNLPPSIDILITHGPPFGILDSTLKGDNAGSKGLLFAVKKMKPLLHIFGHIHESHGYKQELGVRFSNVAKKWQLINL